MAINNQPTIKPIIVTGIFPHFIAKAIPLAFDESMSYYECICALLKYINETVMPDLNNTNAGLEELQNFYTELQSYVNNYFNNLDVQEEINNKLDQMVEDGVLEQIIEQFLQLTSLICFDNVAAMKSSPNLANGSYAKTLGYYAVNDGGESLYKVRTITNEDVVDEMFIIALSNNTLVAELIIKDDTINIMQLGAKAGSSYNITNELKNALSKVKNIIFPSDTFYVTDNIDLDNNGIKGYNTTIVFTNASVNYGLINLKNKSYIENIHLIQSTNNGCFINIRNNNDCYIKDCLIESVDGGYCGAICDINSNTKNLTIYNCHFICHTNADGGFWIRNQENNVTTENITIEKCIIDHFGRDEPLAIWGWNGTVQNIYIKDTEINMKESNYGSTNTHLIRVGYDGTLKNVYFDNCIIKGKYTSEITIFEGGVSNPQNFNINFTNCEIYVTSTSSQAITSGNISFLNCKFYSSKANKLSNSSKPIFNNCIYSCEEQGTFGNGVFYNCILNNNSEVVATDRFLTTNGKAKYVSCTVNNVNYTDSSNQFILLLENGELEIDNFIVNGTVNSQWFILTGTSVLKAKNSIFNKASYIASGTTGYIINCVSKGNIDGGANIYKHNIATDFS